MAQRNILKQNILLRELCIQDFMVSGKAGTKQKII